MKNIAIVNYIDNLITMISISYQKIYFNRNTSKNTK